MSGTSGDLVRVRRQGTTVGCTKQDATGGYSSSSFHFGCEEVDLQPGASVIATFASESAYRAPPGVAVKAQDFLVTYADNAILDPGDTYDATNCRLGLDEEQAGFVLFDFGSGLVGVYWVVSQLPFVDPFISHQQDEGESGAKEYSLFEDAPCLPDGFPAAPGQLAACPSRDGEPPPVEVDLNVFFNESYLASPEETFPAEIQLRTEGDADVRIETDPPVGEPFEMVGGADEIGTLRVCDIATEDDCVAPDLPEGSRLTVTLDFVDPGTGELLFPEVIEFIADTEPPLVRSARAVAGLLEVVASDETTSPLHATAWFSADAGETWEPTSMDIDPPIDAELSGEEPGSRTFTAQIPDGTEVQYFVTIQDTVFNLTFFGPRRAS